MKVEIIDFLNSDDNRLLQINKERFLSLNIYELKAIKEYFKLENRNPTDLEIECIAQSWSEHCKHKVFNSEIEFIENGVKKVYKNLFKETIVKATEEYLKKRGFLKNICVSVFKDNSGIIKFNKRYYIAFKVETHNHPSALDPFGGANTGVGGVIRDILGTGLSAEPIANIDVLCFGFPNFDFKKLPEGVLHPKRIFNGVVQGIKDYGNKIGIPTVNGSIHFDNRYIGNPIVYVGTIGIIPKNRIKKKVKPGDLILVIGGRTGRDGIHGATFSSAELNTSSEKVSATAVQIGDPITEKKFMDVLLKAREKKLFNSITDCGAGGFSSAIGEMAYPIGAEVYLEKVPLKYKNLNPWEIFLSESQERMVLAVPSKKVNKLLEMFKEEDVEATIIGKFTNNCRLKVYYGKKLCGDIDLEFLHKGVPKIIRKAEWVSPKFKQEDKIDYEKDNYNNEIIKILSSPEVASKEKVIREYDFEVKGGTIFKPFAGENQGPSDAAVIMPDFKDKSNGVVISHGINTRLGDYDPYWMAVSAIDEAIRNAVSVGANIEDCALLDNFCWGSPENRKHLGALVKASQACYDYASFLGVPFVSGKDSFYNEFRYFKGEKEKIISIPYTLLISLFGKIKIKNIISMDFKRDGNMVYIIGLTKDEMAGSLFYFLKNKKLGKVPKNDFNLSLKIFKKVHSGIKNGLIISCHDISDGGLAIALAEMCLSSGFGFYGNLKNVPVQNIKFNYQVLFSESNTRFIVEVPIEKHKKFEKFFKDVPFGFIGKIVRGGNFILKDFDNNEIINIPIKKLLNSWSNGLL